MCSPHLRACFFVTFFVFFLSDFTCKWHHMVFDFIAKASVFLLIFSLDQFCSLLKEEYWNFQVMLDLSLQLCSSLLTHFDLICLVSGNLWLFLRVLTNLLQIVSAYFSLFLWRDRGMELPTPPFWTRLSQSDVFSDLSPDRRTINLFSNRTCL